MKYQEIPNYSKEQAESALTREEPSELLEVVIGVGLHAEDFEWAEGYCMRLVRHPHENVRGNAVLALGHLARRGAALSEATVRPAVQKALKDGSEFVRGQAFATADDIEHVLGWRFA